MPLPRLRSLLPAPARPARRPARLGVEPLEDRAVPATIDNLPAGSALGAFGEAETSYYAQSFTALAGSATDLTVELGDRLGGTDGIDFRVLVTGTVRDGSGIRPTGVLFESGTLTHPASGRAQYTVDLGGLALTAGTEYAFVLDAFVARDGVPGTSFVQTRNGYAGGQFFRYDAAQGGADRASHFAADWQESASTDLGFRMTFAEDTAAPRLLQLNVLYGAGQSFDLLANPTRRVMPWQVTGIQAVFDEPFATGTPALTGLPPASLPPETVKDATVYTWTFAAPITAGSFPAAGVAAGPADAAGNAFAGATRAFSVLYGDVSGDGRVTADDLRAVQAAMGGAADPFANLDGLGGVDSADYSIARSRLGRRL